MSPAEPASTSEERRPDSGAIALAGLETADRERRAGILRVLLFAGLAVLGATLVALLLLEGNRELVFWPYAAMLASHLLALALLRAGRLRVAVACHATIYVGTILAVLLFHGGLRSPAEFVLSPMVLLVGLTWNGRAAVVTAALCSVGMFAIAAARRVDGVFGRGELAYAVVATAILVLTSVVLALALGSIERSRRAAVEAERARWRMQEQLLRSQRLESVTRLAAGVAHDFNNLLNVILGQAGLLTARGDEAVAVRSRQIESAAWRASELTRKLLAVGRRQPLEPVRLELNAVVRGVEGLLRDRLARPDSLTLELASEPLELHADATGLEQILLNLVTNAGDATAEGGAIRLRTGRGDGSSTWSGGADATVVLEVADDGHGMSDEIRRHLFEPFFTTKEPGRGTGLGLASVQGIVEQSGGRIAVDSAPGRGTTFRVYLPSAERERVGDFA